LRALPASLAMTSRQASLSAPQAWPRQATSASGVANREAVRLAWPASGAVVLSEANAVPLGETNAAAAKAVATMTKNITIG
jgi:hypothetical protein